MLDPGDPYEILLIAAADVGRIKSAFEGLIYLVRIIG